MNLESFSQKGKISLLTLPRSDLHQQDGSNSKSAAFGLSSAAAIATESETAATSSAPASAPAPPLMLLQLPPNWTPNDLKSAYFISGTISDGGGKSEKNTNKQVSLVVESKQQSFAVHKAETSNVLVLVPPFSPQQPPTSTPTHTNDDPPAYKRLKVVGDNNEQETLMVQSIPARLLSTSGASFLELRPQALSYHELTQALDTYNPYDDHDDDDDDSKKEAAAVGRTLEELAHTLQVSQHEIRRGLEGVQAYPMKIRRAQQPSVSTNSTSYRYVLLSEQAKLECDQAILQALATEDKFWDYANSSLDLDLLVSSVVHSMSDEERFPNVDRVVRFCVLLLSDNANAANLLEEEDDEEEEKKNHLVDFRLNVRKVAVCVARRLFQLQGRVRGGGGAGGDHSCHAPWEETLFLSRWQAELPGVGDAYQVHTSMLKGVAIALTTTDNTTVVDVNGSNKNESSSTSSEVFWKYLPVESLPLDDSGGASGMHFLFRQKPQWTSDELEPYLARLTSSTCTASDLLLRYTKTIVKEDAANSVPVKYHVLR